MQKLWRGGDFMTVKSMVNELVEIGFENASEVLTFAGFSQRDSEHDKDLDIAQDYIRGLTIDEGIKEDLIHKMYTIENNVFDRVSDCAEEYFRAGVCFVLKFLFEATDFQKKLEEKLAQKNGGV